MDSRSLVSRSLVPYTGVSSRAIMRGGLNENQITSIMAVETAWKNHQLSIITPPMMTINQLCAMARRHKQAHGLELLVVDHIKLIERPSKQGMKDYERAYANARDLRVLARDLGCCVLALCQFTKGARQKDSPEPVMEDFYGGSLEEHADVMLANLNRNEWLRANPPTTTGKVKEKWDADLVTTANRMEVYKIKDRFGPGRDRRIFHWNGSQTLMQDIETMQETMFN